METYRGKTGTMQQYSIKPQQMKKSIYSHCKKNKKQKTIPRLEIDPFGSIYLKHADYVYSLTWADVSWRAGQRSAAECCAGRIHRRWSWDPEHLWTAGCSHTADRLRSHPRWWGPSETWWPCSPSPQQASLNWCLICLQVQKGQHTGSPVRKRGFDYQSQTRP